MPIKTKPYQSPPASRPDGILSFPDAVMVQSFGIRSYIIVLPFAKLVSILEGQFDIPKGKPDLPEDLDEVDIEELDRPQAVKVLLALLQRGWNKPRKDNVDKIAEYARRGLTSDKPWDVVHIPEITVYSPNPIHWEATVTGSRVGRVTGELLNVVIDGMTRGTGLKKLMSQMKGVGEEEVVMRLMPGLERTAARQIFADLNTTPIAVPFADVVQRDARRPAFRIALEIADRVPFIKAKQAFMFVQAALLGAKGENAKIEPEITDEAATTKQLVRVVEIFKQAMGSRWTDEQQVLMVGYGLVAIGRLFHDCHGDQQLFERYMQDRVARMSWDRSDTRVQQLGFAAEGKKAGTAKTLLTSYPVIRKFSEVVRSDTEWKALELTDLDYDANQLAAG